MAKLSRLLISEEEENLFCKQFDDILKYVNILESVQTDSTEPLYTPEQQQALVRGDRACKLRERSQVLANAPETDGKYFIVPRIV